MLRKLLLGALAAATAACATAPRDSADRATAFVGVNVVPMTDATTVLRGRTVIVRDGRIAAIGPAGSVRVPAGATRIDGEGAYLMPGLADMHVHLEHIEDPDILALFLAHGVTTVRSMDGRPFILDWRRRVAAGEIAGPEIVTAGPIIDGSPPLRADNLAVADAPAATAAVAAQADAGYDFVKVYTNLSPEAHRAVVAAARERRLQVAGHVPRNLDLAEAIATHASIEHLADYGEAIDVPAAGQPRRWRWSDRFLAIPVDPERMAALAAALARSSVWTVPTLIQSDRELARPEDLAAWRALPEMALIPDEGRGQWLREAERFSARLDVEDWALLARGRENRLRLVGALHAAGARLLLGTDTPNPFVVPGASVHDELQNFVLAGLSPGEALLAGTRDAARFLGQAEEWGTVERGRQADLILLAANPLTEIANTRRRIGVMRRGRWYPEAELRTMAQRPAASE